MTVSKHTSVTDLVCQVNDRFDKDIISHLVTNRLTVHYSGCNLNL